MKKCIDPSEPRLRSVNRCGKLLDIADVAGDCMELAAGVGEPGIHRVAFTV
jgi:hypothetical protein